MRNSKWIWIAFVATVPLAGCLSTGCLSRDASKYTQRLGEPAKLDFQSSPQLVHTIEIARSSPQAWSARFTRGEPVVSGDDPSWRIDSAINPQGHPVRDRLAFQSRLDHLLETLVTLTIIGPAPRGSLASLGLEPPLASLRWQTEDGLWELSLGDIQSDGTQVCDSPSWREPQMCRGAALEMIAQVQKLDQMRLPTWATFSPDQILQIEIRKPGQAPLHVERKGEAWVSRGKKLALQDSLEKLTHSRIQAYIEEEDKLAALKKALKEPKTPGTELVFRLSSGDLTRLKVIPREGRWIGTNSARPDGTFELYPETAQLVQRLGR